MKSRLLATAFAVVGLITVSVRGAPAARVQWMWSGAVTASSAVVKARVSKPGVDTVLLISPQADLGGAGSGRVTAKATESGIAIFTLEDLQPRTRYYYAVEAEGVRSDIGRFRTFANGPVSFRAVTGSCASTGSRSTVFSVMQSLDPDLLIHTGDFHYENIRQNQPARFLRAYDDVFQSRTQAALYRSVPIVYMWDDHDYGPNDADRTSPSREASRLMYRLVVPHYPLPLATTINQAFTVGRVRFIVTDNRSERTPAGARDDGEKSMLGKAQLAWFLQELEQAAARDALVVWVNSVPWITRQGDPTHGWQPFSRERTVVADRISQLGLTNRLLMFSGDAHMTAMDDGRHSNYAAGAGAGEPGFVVVQAGPFDQRVGSKGGPYSTPVSLKRGQFVVADFNDDGQRIAVSLTARSKEGAELAGIRIDLTCDIRGCSTGARGGR